MASSTAAASSSKLASNADIATIVMLVMYQRAPQLQGSLEISFRRRMPNDWRVSRMTGSRVKVEISIDPRDARFPDALSRIIIAATQIRFGLTSAMSIASAASAASSAGASAE